MRRLCVGLRALRVSVPFRIHGRENARLHSSGFGVCGHLPPGFPADGERRALHGRDLRPLCKNLRRLRRRVREARSGALSFLRARVPWLCQRMSAYRGLVRALPVEMPAQRCDVTGR
jgi:hypothetical protein